MASPFSSSTITDTEIDAIIAQAIDLHTLEQIASLNTAHLSDSPLSFNLETRFQKLKSLPPSINKEENQSPPDNVPDPLEDLKPNKELDIGIVEELPRFQEKENIPNSLNQRNVEPEWLEVAKEEKLRSGSSSSSPLKQICCCFSPFQRSPNRNAVSDEDDDEILSEFGSAASIRKQRRKLKKAWREQEKASREAEKMVRWVEQVSTKINEAAMDELLREEFKL